MKAPHLLVVVLVFIMGFAVGRVAPEDIAGTAEPAATEPTPGMPEAKPAAAKAIPASASAPSTDRVPQGLSAEERRDIEVFRRASMAVVSVRAVALRYNLFTLDVMQIPRGQGSGFVWDRQGHIVTNFHVIEGGNAFVVTLADQSEWEAEVVGRAPEKDLAVLRIKAPADRLPPLALGRSADLAVGQRVLALGNPFGLDQSLTVGVLSALGRELESPARRVIRDVIQTDAAINPGNSGGPLLDSNGRVIGVNTAIYSPSGASAGIGFAIPVDTVGRLVPQLIEFGKPIQPGIGIRPVPAYLIPGGIEGVPVWDVTEGGPAARAGIEGVRPGRSSRRYILGDVIVAVDGQPILSVDDLLDAFEVKGVGATVTLTVEQDGRRREVEVTLVELR